MTTRADRAAELAAATETVDKWRSKFEKYHTSESYCGCPDYSIRKDARPCKHQLAIRFLGLVKP